MTICLVVLGLFLGGSEVVETQQVVKVHKGLITVSGQGDDGLVEVSGAEGAIESDDPVRLRVMNLETDEKVLVEWNERGNFRAYIAATAGQKVRVEAYNKVAKKRSIGTFTVPQGSGTAARVGQGTEESGIGAGVGVSVVKVGQGAEDNHKVTNDQEKVASRDAGGGKTGQRELVVLVVVMDGGTGQVLAKEQVTGMPWEKVRRAEQYKVVGKTIIRDCVEAVRSELKPTLSRKARRYEIRILDGEQVQREFSDDNVKAVGPADPNDATGGIKGAETTIEAEAKVPDTMEKQQNNAKTK